MRREQPRQTEAESSEKARLEVESYTNDVQRLQNELAELARAKTASQDDFDVQMKRQDEELDLKKQSVAREKILIEEGMVQSRKELESMKTELSSLRPENENLKTENTSLTITRDTLTSQVSSLKTEHNSESSALAKTRAERVAEERIFIDEQNKLVLLQSNVRDAQVDLERITKERVLKESEARTAEENRVAAEASYTSILEGERRAKTSIAEAHVSVEASQSIVADARREASKIMAEAKKKDHASNERMKNASILEHTVGIKLEKLKEAEAEFTTAHLARIGYKKIDA